MFVVLVVGGHARICMSLLLHRMNLHSMIFRLCRWERIISVDWLVSLWYCVLNNRTKTTLKVFSQTES